MSQVAVELAPLLHSYTGGRGRLSAEGNTLGEVLDDLDRRYPGVKFRVVDEQGQTRPHVRFFVNQDAVRKLEAPLAGGDRVYIVGALSGG